MPSHARPLVAGLAVCIYLAAGSTALGQYIGPRRQSAAPPRAAESAPAGNSQSGGGQQRPQGQYPVRRAQATQPAGQNAPGPSGAAPQQALAQPPAPQAPFNLSPSEQALIDQILLNWEKQSDRVNTFACKFDRWEVNQTFGPAQHNHVLSQAEGEIKFKGPDHGIYLVHKALEWDGQQKSYVTRSEGLDHWVCNGEAIFEYNAEKKELIERQLAPGMQGKAITDGPLPFVFGAKADQLKRRYWMRDITPAEQVNKQIWLEAWPKFQRDAANFQHAIIILNQRDYMPSALRIILPDGKNKQDYVFKDTWVNNLITRIDFVLPKLPLGWRKVVIPPGGAEQVAAPADGPAQARQPAAPPPR